MFVETVSTMGGYAVGYGLVGAFLAFLWYRDGGRWRELAEAYGHTSASPRRVKNFQTIILRGERLIFNHYRAARVGMCDTGLCFSLHVPWSVFHPPFLIPFEDIELTPSMWCFTNRVAVITRKVPAIKIVVWPELLEWLDKENTAP